MYSIIFERAGVAKRTKATVCKFARGGYHKCVDRVLVTFSLLGGIFALLRPLAALVSGAQWLWVQLSGATRVDIIGTGR